MIVRKALLGSRTKGSAAGVLIPLYVYPGPSWDEVVKARKTYPSVPVMSVINPGNGPGKFKDPNYVTGIKELVQSGVTVLGYVFTAYGLRNENSVLSDVDAYKKWYEIDGIMFDEMSISNEYERYYSALARHVKSTGLRICMGNPGRTVPPGSFGQMDLLNIYEEFGLPDTLFLKTSRGFDKDKCSLIAYGISRFDRSVIRALSGVVTFLYLTDGNLPNPYGSLPSYFWEILDSLEQTGLTR